MLAFFTAISSIVAIISIIISIITYKENNKWAAKANKSAELSNRLAELSNGLQEELVRIQARDHILNWNDIENYVKMILKKMNVDNFIPDCIITPFVRDAIVASMLSQEISKTVLINTIPIYVGMLVYKDIDEEFKIDGFDVMPLPNSEKIPKKTYMVIQNKLSIKPSNKILLLRDHTASGISLNTMKENLISKYSLESDNIRTACIAYSESIRHKINYFCFSSSDVWFPWDKNI